MKRYVVFGALVSIGALACGGGAPRAAGERVAASGHGPRATGRPAAEAVPVVAPDLVYGDDVLTRVLAQNSTTVASPPRTFRAIPVTAMDVSTLSVTKSETGFRVALPSGAPVVTPTVYRDLVVVSGGFRSRQMFAFRAGAGDPVWGVELGDDGPSMPACKDDVCVFNTESCTIFAVQAQTGELLWSWYLGDPLMSSPTIANGLVFAAYPALGAAQADGKPVPEGVTHALAAFRLRTGELVWAKWIDADVISAPMAVADAVFVSTFAGTMYKLDQQTGDIIAAHEAHATSAPVYVDGALYYSRRDEATEVATAADGSARPAPRVSERLVRSQKPGGAGRNMQETQAMPADQLRYDFYQGTVHAAESTANDAANGFSGGAPQSANTQAARMMVGRASVHGLQEFQGAWVLSVGAANYAVMGESLVSVERDTMRARWSQPLPGDLATLGILAAPPANASGTIVVPTTTGDVLLVNPRHGNTTRRFPVGSPLRTQAVVENGWIYVGTGAGELVGIDTGDRHLTGWPTWAGNAARTGSPEP